MMGLPNFSLVYANGQPYKLNDYENHIILIVNTASKCSLANQFRGLEDLYRQFKDDKFVVLGFPSNQFNSEPLDYDQIEEFCTLNYNATFPFNQLVQLNGAEAEPVFRWLKQEKSGIIGADIKWNFTKFLINRQGQVIKRYSPLTKPDRIAKDIQKLL